jgi:hypothetical protein
MRHGRGPSRASSAMQGTGSGHRRESRTHGSASPLTPDTTASELLAVFPWSRPRRSFRSPWSLRGQPCSNTGGAYTPSHTHTVTRDTEPGSLVTVTGGGTCLADDPSPDTRTRTLATQLVTALTRIAIVVRDSPIPFNSTKIHCEWMILHASLDDFSPIRPDWKPGLTVDEGA